MLFFFSRLTDTFGLSATESPIKLGNLLPDNTQYISVIMENKWRSKIINLCCVLRRRQTHFRGIGRVLSWDATTIHLSTDAPIADIPPSSIPSTIRALFFPRVQGDRSQNSRPSTALHTLTYDVAVRSVRFAGHLSPRCDNVKCGVVVPDDLAHAHCASGIVGRFQGHTRSSLSHGSRALFRA